ncbi:MAG: serine/threonine-protein kinase [bacterium]|jgi:serine/threonine protein kinase
MTTRSTEIYDDETVLESQPPSPPVDPDIRRLIADYHSIIKSRSILSPIPYQFSRELGKGRQGVVFLATRQGGRGCHTRHAIKIHDPGIYSSAEKYWIDMGRLASQVSKLQPVHSDNLVPHDTYDETNGIGYLQMSVIDGIDLQYLLNGSHLAIARSQSSDEEWDHFMNTLFRVEDTRFILQPGVALYILRKILMGLMVLHEANYLHADIKPSNIMIDRMGSVKLVDFGRAVEIGEKISILLGSPIYMAPETHRLEPGRAQTDLFSAGLVALEMLCGESLHVCNDMDDATLLQFKLSLFDRVESMLPPFVQKSKRIVRLLKRFLDPDPEQRYSSAHEAEESYYRLRGIYREMGQDADAEYDRELLTYLQKITDPNTGFLNPRLE